MTETKFTKRPWHTCGYKVVDAEGFTVAKCGYTLDKTEEEAEANADLIAAAPRMFEVLEEIKRLIDEYLDGTYETLAVGLTQQQKMNLIDTVSRYKFSIVRDMINAVLLTIVE